jgi:hypothetical protein
MRELIKPWNDSGSLSVTYDGDRDGSATFSSDIAEGLNREMQVLFVDQSRSVIVERLVRQEGMREELVDSDGGLLLSSDGGTLNVLKEWVTI